MEEKRNIMVENKQIEYGAFCQLYGKSLRNRVLEFILELGELDFAVRDILYEIMISKPKVYQIIKELEDENLIVKSREISKTQLFVLNVQNKKVKLLMKNFNECLIAVIDEYEEDSILDAYVFVDGINISDILNENKVISA